jgi:L-threonylcarbamoyladenylate synthase
MAGMLYLSLMKTQIVDLSQISLAVELLKKGEPIVFPTETVYGLGGPFFHREAVQRIFTIKNRPTDNPLIVHVSSISEALDLIEDPPAQFFFLANQFWPGPLTLVLKAHPKVSSFISGNLSTIAIRIPSHPIALELLQSFGAPLVAPSANLSGRPSPTCALDVLEDLEGKVPLVLDGGPCSIGIESTVLSLVGPQPVLLRPGSITKETLEATLQTTIILPTSEETPLSPGMKYRHYAPKARIHLLYDRSEIQGSYVLSRIPQEGERPLSQKTLFSEFREADRREIPLIEVYCDSMTQADQGLMNRLLKAAEEKEEALV